MGPRGGGLEAVTHALALEPELAEGYCVLGAIQMSHDWDWRAAEASCRRALALAPGSSFVQALAAAGIGILGHLDEAIELYRQALQQDPLNSFAYHNLAEDLNRAGRTTEAELACRKALELAPQRVMTRFHLAMSLLAQGRGEEALSAAQQEPEEWARLVGEAIIQHAAGRHAESEAALQELIAKYQREAAYQVAEVYAARSEADLAFAWLERAYVQRDSGLAYLRVVPEFRRLYADPRWGGFLRKMRFAD